MFNAVSQDPRAQQAFPATPSFQGVQSTAPVPTLSELSSQLVGRLSSLRDQLEKMNSVIEPMPNADQAGRPQRSGIVGTLQDASDLLGEVENFAQRIGARL